MNLDEIKDMLIYDLSAKLIASIKSSSKNKKELVEILYPLAWTEEQPYAWRAAWLLEHIVEDDKELIKPYLQEISERLYNAHTDAQKRHFLKILLMFDLEDLDMGRLLDLSFQWLESPSESIAVRGHCITALDRILKVVPDIKEEFIAMLSLLSHDESAGLKNKSRRLLQKLR